MSEENGQEGLDNEGQDGQATGEEGNEGSGGSEMLTREQFEAETMGLKNTVEATRKERDEMKNKYSELANQLEEMKNQFGGIDVEEYKQMQERKAQEREDAAKAGNEEAFAEYKAKAEANQAEKEAEFRKMIAEKDEMIARKEQLLQVELVDSSIKSAIMKAGGNDKTVDMLAHIVRSRVSPVVSEETGRLELHVVGDSGERRWTAEGNNPVPLTVDDFAEEVRDVYPQAFPGTGASGTGAAGGVLGKQNKFDALERKHVDEWTAEEKDSYTQERGNDAFKKQLNRSLGLPQT